MEQLQPLPNEGNVISLEKKLKKRIAKLETKLAKYETLTRQLNTTWNTGGWDTVDKVYEAREAVGNLVRHLKEGKKDGV